MPVACSLQRCPVLLACLLGLGASQIHVFDKETAPTSRSLSSKFAFYVYGHDEAPPDSDSAPSVSFEHVSVRCGDSIYRNGACVYSGIQLALIRWEDFNHVVDRTRFCCTDDMADRLGCTANNLFLQNVSRQPGFSFKPLSVRHRQSEVYVYTVRGQEQVDHAFTISGTGLYLLFLSNCGYEDSVTPSGRITVRNYYGLLPGNEYPKKAFNGWLAVTYTALLSAWGLLMATSRQELFNIHFCFAAAILAAAVRAIFWWVYLGDWNAVGTRSVSLLKGVVLAEGVHVALSTFLLLSASCGWGITLLVLQWNRLMKLLLVCVAYGAASSAGLFLLDMHTDPEKVSVPLMTLGCVQLVLSVCILCAVCRALSQQTHALADPRHRAKLRLFIQVRRILCLTMLFFVATVTLQVHYLARNRRDSWETEWIWKDGLPRSLEAFSLMLMMFLWAPYSYRKRYNLEQPEAEVLVHSKTQQTELTQAGCSHSPLVL